MFRPDDLFLQMVALGMIRFYAADQHEITWNDMSEEVQQLILKSYYEHMAPTPRLIPNDSGSDV